MSASIANTNSEIQATSPVPVVAFAEEPDRRGRDHSVTPLIEEEIVVDSISTEAKTKKSYRNSLTAFAERIRSRSSSRQRGADDLSMSRTSTQASAFSVKSTSSRKSSKSGSRSGRNSLDNDSSPYADVVRAQSEFMEKLRAEQEKNGVTHNADGIPIPPSRNGSRRSSITHILGFDKPLLAF
ncbi:hypothetical protein BX616_003505 [Lobosporangium transversale]|uniref:Uncharacterized protein n=1 Tax=Lobosporangium transversale TaxID=64571 RepID=A0A1Y2G709_9FUNG|nr:hypothetical protein BCR41DRAFT_363892 [Lobosporangium transversale]KAF9918985.1 hypothetical protein BX616_003505 [Lobosporangium transversale]ORY99586.1 hypothetical protein BCR41DRAFT_363892 [Lobosporangium transversale]|eukprot:XP_021875881.1 hypothetical protein BCR41DRAFT_363892 [Lobosporangium transversale]